MLQGLFTSSTCWFPFFWWEGRHLALDGRAPFAVFCGWWWCSGQTKLYNAVYSNKLCNETWTTFQQCLEAWKPGRFVSCFFEISKRWIPPECSERSVFRSTSPDLGPGTHHWNGGTFFPLILGANPNPEFYPGLVYPGWNSGFRKDIFSWYISQVTLNWYGKTCQKKSHLTSAFCVCFTLFVQGLLFPRWSCPSNLINCNPTIYMYV